MVRLRPGDGQWPDETWQDYPAPILTRDGLRFASYGFIPKRHQPAACGSAP
ncbi:Uncharacterised protein [Chromobacterium violaceum]|uniref:Uncharacterized protein n=1 Tax=Chromobacterium violaceum TaxID=536 RepID=A0A447TDV5_CHRVL|nr:Uncharacterised protein [Chromobacterium violaceum]